ncbi:type III-A CRISPR-associated RAMP protein Csm4 [Clostridium sp. MD294]|uniref:type III-A CRISPR-associated RAMP protein Csm4 n=1 Tax=Clostridium sp. MD294 TaxID=97138 RepID=UPI0002C8DD4F|nr:type III-A CRISPR-associated RAMP protein Csm4 [Clostridium sp. MD294]NDO45313.1 type III-A CRISPR-associated RAMP protein Csm4 [Clostridium sp. MD294]USF31050.1 CRISPR system Cms protein Csm4 [Clostridium sp. MD294]
MDYFVYKMYFKTPIHVGNGTLANSENIIMADTIFSALCCEAGNQKNINSIVDMAKNRKFIISDAMPFVEDELYIPKPMAMIKTESEGNSILKKAFKKLKYIPVSNINTYMEGNINPLEQNQKMKLLGKSGIRTMSSSVNEEKIKTGDMLPFQVGIYNFSEKSGLYFFAGFESDNEKQFFEKLFLSVSYSGIGGKRSSGFGKFDFIVEDIPQNIKECIGVCKKQFITLSVSMAQQNELEKALENANYLLVKRSGFIFSETYAETMRKKKDFYCFKSGSYFTNAFQGDVFDVSGSGTHKVYRYAIPLFMEVD